MKPASTLCRHLAALLLSSTALLVAPATLADDLDIYTTPVTLPLQAPLAALALDLSITDPNTLVCNNILLSTDANCVSIRAKVTLAELLTYLGLPTSVVGGVDPNSLLSDLSTGVLAVLSTPLSVGGSLSFTQQQLYVLGVQQIISALIDTRLSIILNHNNRGPGTGVCAFADLASLPAARQDTLACSNGAYLFAGLTNLADPLQLAALLTRVATALLPGAAAFPPQPSIFSANHPYQAKEIYAELIKYLRGDAIFNGHLGYYDYGDANPTTNLNASFPLLSWDTNAETADRRSYNSGLAAYPQACTISLVHVQLTNAAAQDDSDADVKALLPDVDNNGALTLPEVVTAAQDTGFSYGASDRRFIQSRFVVQENLFTNGDQSDLDKINSTGGNVSSYTNIVGLLGRGKSIAASLVQPLSVNTALSSLTIAASRSSGTGILQAAYLPAFRSDSQQRPVWPGNLKRLKLRPKGTNQFDVVDARDTGSGSVVKALNASGRILSTALTLWTDSTKLGSGVANDGGVADLGGAGQKIPGFVFGGGGNPGRTNGNSLRRIYYDSQLGSGNTLCSDLTTCGVLNPDDGGVRTELLAATGATAYVSPSSVCTTSCNTAFSACGLVCGNTQTSCGLTCTTSNTTCNSLCVPGTLGDSCRASCSTSLTSCNGSCTTAANSCNTSCGNNLSSCLTTCGGGGTDRSADTIARELLLYARGFNVGTRTSPAGTGPSSSPTNTGVVGRPWMLGAVLHSKPLAINYGKRNGSTNADVVRVVYGSADGMLHMVDDDTGVESWGFMPQSVMGTLATQRENQGGATLPYGVDGSPMVLIRDRTGSSLNSAADGIISTTSSSFDRVLLVFGLRRGGAAYYALDVTDPDSPKMVWRITTQGLLRAGQTTVDAGSATQFAALGLAFSMPQAARVRIDADGVSSTTNDITNYTALVFGGGYNGGRNTAGGKIGKDLNNSRAVTPVSTVGVDDGSASTDRGNALFMIDAATGQLLWRAVRTAATTASYTAASKTYAHPLLVDSIASDVTVLDTDNDGYSDRLYVGDTGGRLWRADFSGSIQSVWTLTPVASVGRHNTGSSPSYNTLTHDRRIFFAPDYVPLRNKLNNQGTDLVLFGTGDREDPLNLTTQNWFYAYRDTDTVSGKAASEVLLAETSLPQHTSFNDYSSVASPTDVSSLPATSAGYRFSYARTGEKHFSAPVTLDGTSVFTSYVPPDPAAPSDRVCTPSEGVSRLYSIKTRTSKFFNVNGVSSGRDVQLATGLAGEINTLSGTNQAAGGQVYSITAKPSYRASWRERLGETQK